MNKLSRTDKTVLTVVVAAILTTICLSPLSIKQSREEYRLKKQNRSSLVNAIANSAGDRIWSTNEKRQFLDNHGIYSIIGEGQDIYFREKDYKVEVIAGYNLENNGGFLFGSNAKSGTKIGEISYSRLRR